MTLEAKCTPRLRESLWAQQVHRVEGRVVKYIGPVRFPRQTPDTRWAIWQGLLFVHVIRTRAGWCP